MTSLTFPEGTAVITLRYQCTTHRCHADSG
jgi:hypothetical protein